MNKICILIGEGLSERHFFPSFISENFGFTAENDKQTYIFSNAERNIFWLFLYPPGRGMREGKSRFYCHETYREASLIIEQHKHLFGKNVEKHFHVIHDVDIDDAKHIDKSKQQILNAYRQSRVRFDSFEVCFVNSEIESWFIAGLTVSFPHLDKKKNNEIVEILKKDPEKIHDPKSSLDNILVSDLKGLRMKIGELFGANFDIAKARKLSKSFNEFITNLENKELL